MTEPGPPQPYDPPSGSQPVGQPYGSSPFPGQDRQYGSPPHGAQPYGSPPARPRRNGLGTAALVLGVLAVLLSFTVVLIVLALPLAVLALVLGILGRKRAQRGEADNRAVATAGLVLGIVGIVLSMAIGFVAGSAVKRLFDSPEGRRLAECLEQAGGDQARAQVCRDEFLRTQRG